VKREPERKNARKMVKQLSFVMDLLMHCEDKASIFVLLLYSIQDLQEGERERQRERERDVVLMGGVQL